MKLSELPENYRKAQGIEDFSIGCTTYIHVPIHGLVKGEVKDILTYSHDGRSLVIAWNGFACCSRYSFSELCSLYVKEKEQKYNFKVNDRVLLVEKGEFKPRVKITGTILDVRNQYIAVKWDDIAAEDAISYSKDQWKHIEVINKAPKELILDLKIHFNLDTTRIETVLIDCVKALVSNGKYKEAKELCELLLSVQNLGKAKDAPLDAPQDDSIKGS